MAVTRQQASDKKRMLELGGILLICFCILILFPTLMDRNQNMIMGTWQVNSLVYEDDNGETKQIDLTDHANFIQFGKNGRFNLNIDSTGNRAGKWKEETASETKENPHVYSLSFTDNGDDYRGAVTIDDNNNMFIMLADDTDYTFSRYTAVPYEGNTK